MKKAYSYQRFSSIKQSKGDSIRRQSVDVPRFCQEHKLQLVSTMMDHGVSAFKGKNFSDDAALGQFVRLIEEGTVDRGSVLIVENMDRISRETVSRALGKFLDIINAGVSIGVPLMNKIFDEESIAQSPQELMFVLIEFARANSESKIKSERIKAVIGAKLAKVKAGEKVWFGAFEPTWIVGLKDSKFIQDSEKVSLVRQIFKLYLAGDSCSNIANILNKKNIPTLRGLKRNIWTNATVAEILRNKNVMGWFGGNDVEVEDYYPVIISPKDFQDAQVKLAANVKSRGGSKYGLVRNIFRGLLYCAECGQTIESKMYMYHNVKGTITHYTKYICRGVKQHTSCKNIGRIDAMAVEMAVFEMILGKHPSSLLKPAKANPEILELENKLAKTKGLISRLTDLLADEELQDVAELKGKLTQAVAQEKTLKSQLDTLNTTEHKLEDAPKAIATLTSMIPTTPEGFFEYAADNANELNEWHRKYQQFISDTENRKKLRNIMPQVFNKITIEHHKKDKMKIAKIVCQLVNNTKVTASIAEVERAYIFTLHKP